MIDYRRELSLQWPWKSHKYIPVALIGIHADEVSRATEGKALLKSVCTPQQKQKDTNVIIGCGNRFLYGKAFDLYFKEALIIPSFPRKRESRLLISRVWRIRN